MEAEKVICFSGNMSQASDLAEIKGKLSFHFTVFRCVAGGAVAWLVALSWLLCAMNGGLSRINGALSPYNLEKAAEQPTVASNQRQVVDLIAEAKKANTPLPSNIIEKAGQSFIAAAGSDSKAWDTAKALFEYRSDLNRAEVKIPINLQPKLPPEETVTLQKQTTTYAKAPVPGKSSPKLWWSGVVPPDQGARFEEIGKNLNSNVPVGDGKLVFRSGAVSLDGRYIKNVIFEGVEIHYSGKPLVLENVSFVNCKFVIENTAPSRQLGRELLASSTVDFRNEAA